MQYKTVIFSSLFIVILLYSCSRRPGNVLNEAKLTEVLYDVQLAQSIGNTQSHIYNTPPKKRLLVISALNKHGVSQADFDSTLLWYSDNDISKYNEINDTVAYQLRRQVNRIRENMAVGGLKRTNEGQIMPSIVYLTENNPIVSFNIDSLKLKTLKPETFKWSFDVQGLSPMQKVSAGIIFTYKDTSISILKPLDINKHYIFEKPHLADSLLKNISGYIRLRNSSLPANIIIFNIKNNDSLSISNVKKPDNSDLRNNKDNFRKVSNVDKELMLKETPKGPDKNN